MSAAVTTPDLQSLDADALRGLVLSQHRQLNAQNIEIENLKLLVAKLRREQFGSKSEKLDSHLRQLELELEDREIQQAAAPPAVSMSTHMAPHVLLGSGWSLAGPAVERP